MEEETERKCSLNAVKSASRTMSTIERVAAPSEANKAHSLSRNDHVYLLFCAVRKRACILELFQPNVYALSSFSHFSHFVAYARPTVPKARAMPTNPHVLVQRSWRCAQGIHCEYVPLVTSSVLRTYQSPAVQIIITDTECSRAWCPIKNIHWQGRYLLHAK